MVFFFNVKKFHWADVIKYSKSLLITPCDNETPSLIISPIFDPKRLISLYCIPAIKTNSSFRPLFVRLLGSLISKYFFLSAWWIFQTFQQRPLTILLLVVFFQQVWLYLVLETLGLAKLHGRNLEEERIIEQWSRYQNPFANLPHIIHVNERQLQWWTDKDDYKWDQFCGCECPLGDAGVVGVLSADIIVNAVWTLWLLLSVPDVEKSKVKGVGGGGESSLSLSVTLLLLQLISSSSSCFGTLYKTNAKRKKMLDKNLPLRMRASMLWLICLLL